MKHVAESDVGTKPTTAHGKKRVAAVRCCLHGEHRNSNTNLMGIALERYSESSG
jgi:hypothetical protein